MKSITRPSHSRETDSEIPDWDHDPGENSATAELLLPAPESYASNNNHHLRDELMRISLLIRIYILQQRERVRSKNDTTTLHSSPSEEVITALLPWALEPAEEPQTKSSTLTDLARLELHIVHCLSLTPPQVRSKLPVWNLARRFQLVPNLLEVIPAEPLQSRPDSTTLTRETVALDLVLLAYVLDRNPNYRTAIQATSIHDSDDFITTETALHIVQPELTPSELRWDLFSQTSNLRQLLTLSPLNSGRERIAIEPQTAAFLSDHALPIDPVVGDSIQIVHKWRQLDKVRLDASVVDQLRSLSTWWWYQRGSNPFVAVFRGASGSPFLEALQALVTWSDGGKPSRLAWPIMVIDTHRLIQQPNWTEAVNRIYREALHRQCALLWTHAETLINNAADRKIDELIHHAIRSNITTVLASTTGWDPPEEFRVPDRFFVQVDMPTPAAPVRRATWRDRLARDANEIAEDSTPFQQATLDVLESFEFTQGEIQDAISIARGYALLTPQSPQNPDAKPTAEFLIEACRRQAARRQISFTQRVVSRPFPDEHGLAPKEILQNRVVLPASASQQLDELFDRIAHYTHVYHDLGFERRLSLGQGVIALFSGSPGTGKTLAATTLSRLLKKDLYKVDASAVASKFVGETERNLGRVFADVRGANAILFFDEADALFGKRGEVVQASDRWANLQISYLLQRIEEYTGTVILATNNKDSIDAAFFRRMQVLIDFPRPDPASRLKILYGLLSGTSLAIADAKGTIVTEPDDIRAVLKPVTDRFDLSGGNLKNVALDAAFRAVANGSAVPTLTVRELLLAVARELQKEGKSISVVTFGKEWYALVERELQLDRNDIAKQKR